MDVVDELGQSLGGTGKSFARDVGTTQQHPICNGARPSRKQRRSKLEKMAHQNEEMQRKAQQSVCTLGELALVQIRDSAAKELQALVAVPMQHRNKRG